MPVGYVREASVRQAFMNIGWLWKRGRKLRVLAGVVGAGNGSTAYNGPLRSGPPEREFTTAGSASAGSRFDASRSIKDRNFASKLSGSQSIRVRVVRNGMKVHFGIGRSTEARRSAMSRKIGPSTAVACFMGCVLAWSGAASADPPAPPSAPPSASPKPTEEKPEFPKFEEVCKDFEKVKPIGGEETPFLNLLYNKKTDQLFAQIPANLVGKRFLVAVSVSGGPSATGFQIDHWLAYLERMDKNLVLMRVDPRYAADEGQPVADVVKRSYTDEIAKVIPIKTMQGQDPVIDLGDLFKGDFAGV